jgi:hypothetical protein
MPEAGEHSDQPCAKANRKRAGKVDVVMDFPRLEYKGYTILAKPNCGTDGKWFGGYEILKNGEPVSVRSNIFPSFFYVEAACADSMEHAKLEIDNRVSESSDSH